METRRSELCTSVGSFPRVVARDSVFVFTSAEDEAEVETQPVALANSEVLVTQGARGVLAGSLSVFFMHVLWPLS